MGIIEFGTYAGAIITIITLLGMLLKSVCSFKNAFHKLEEHTRENYMATLRITVVSEEMPLSERIAAGDKYVALGGNGQVKAIYKKLIERYEKENAA